MCWFLAYWNVYDIISNLQLNSLHDNNWLIIKARLKFSFNHLFITNAGNNKSLFYFIII